MFDRDKYSQLMALHSELYARAHTLVTDTLDRTTGPAIKQTSAVRVGETINKLAVLLDRADDVIALPKFQTPRNVGRDNA